MAASRLSSKRSSTGKHTLFPATSKAQRDDIDLPAYNTITWTFGRGSVIWRIWPAVLLHTLFAAGIVSLSLKTRYSLDIPNIMLTVMGVVIGFVISYRAMSGYDRYWMGRGSWGDIIRTSRTLSRLIWLHVPLRLKPKPDGTETLEPDVEEMLTVMTEKHIALDLVEGFSVALKHHIRGELGIYFEDLYPLVRPLHEHSHFSKHANKSHHTLSQNIQAQHYEHGSLTSSLIGTSSARASSARVTIADPFIPPINVYGTFNPSNPLSPNHLRRNRSSSSLSSHSSHRRLLPSSLPGTSSILSKISGDLIPFSSFFNAVRQKFLISFGPPQALEVLPPGVRLPESAPDYSGEDGGVERKWGQHGAGRLTHSKHRPRVAGSGENIPLMVLQCLSDWSSVLEERGIVPGTSLGPLIGCLGQLDDSLSTLEKILTTPLPFVYSVHISTVWLYLFFLPFQLVKEFGWYTIPGVGMAAFIYLGFVAAGEEIEQPFGYDENDLDLDLFCCDIVHADVARLRRMPGRNVYHSGEHVEPFGIVGEAEHGRKHARGT